VRVAAARSREVAPMVRVGTCSAEGGLQGVGDLLESFKSWT
jgi:hypothetical protein